MGSWLTGAAAASASQDTSSAVSSNSALDGSGATVKLRPDVDVRSVGNDDFDLIDTPTNTPTDTPTNTPVPPTNTPTDTPTNTSVPPTNTSTNTPTNRPVPPTRTSTNTPTNTPAPSTNTPTNTPTDTPTSTPTYTPTNTPTNTPTYTPTPYISRLTPGYWKNHLAQARNYLPLNLGSYPVNSASQVTKVFNAMNCSSSKPNDAIGCLAGHLLAAKLNVANGTGACISPIITKADAFLSGQVVDGVTGISYTGPSGTYTLTTAQRNLAISLKTLLDKYNNNISCP